MRYPGLGGGLFPRALTALFVAFVATAAALHLFFADTAQQPTQAELEQIAAGSLEIDSCNEKSEFAQPAPPSILIRTMLDRTAPLKHYLTDMGVGEADARAWTSFFQEASSSTLVRKDHPITIFKDPETGELRGLKYDLDERTQIFEANLGNGVIKAFQQPIHYSMHPVSVAFAIHDGFHKAVLRNHVPSQVIDTLEDAFSSKADLERLPPGSAVKVIWEERVSRDGNHRITGDVQAAEIHTGMHTVRAFAFRDEHGRAHLYDEEGHALGPQFLRFPVNFQYISSGFTFHRYHPILHAYRPHVGVDLVAEYGTPVKAIADGRVEVAGWCGELGNCVRIEHENATTSIYGHLSRVSPTIGTGSYVKMGQVIGLVGSTGLSTGPHLHFALEKRGAYVNPLTEKLGVNHAVSPKMKALFDNLRTRYQTALAKMPDLGSRFAAPGSRKPAISPLGDMYHVNLDRPASRTRSRLRRHRHASAEREHVTRTVAESDSSGGTM